MRLRAPAPIENVADTASWVAEIRACESARADALFRDPLAARLAGERGRRIARALPDGAATAWGVVMRTCAIDRLLEDALAAGIDCVVNLGAGLDTRPYRLDLPASLHWVEVDLPPLIAAKNAQLAAETPRCRVERLGLDLRAPGFAAALRARLPPAAGAVLLISEGVIPYLTAERAAELARELRTLPGVRCWLQDYENAGLRRPLPRRWTEALAAAPLLFQAPNWFEFFREQGWRPARVLTSGEQGARAGRPFPWTFPRGWLLRLLPASWRRGVLDATGAVLLEPAAAD